MTADDDTALQLVSALEVAPQRWRNGGGQTRELLAWCADAATIDGRGVDDWSLRISVADITRDGPFSAFPGVERWFAVIDGAGVLLQADGQQVALQPGDAPIRFDGRHAPVCRLRGGPTRDLNLMLRQPHGHGEMRRAVPGVEIVDAAPFRAIFTATALTLCVDDRPAVALAPLTLAWCARACGQRWQMQASGAADDLPAPCGWWLSFTALS